MLYSVACDLKLLLVRVPLMRLQYFEHHGVEVHLLALPTCEQNKELELVTAIADALEDFKINRWG